MHKTKKMFTNTKKHIAYEQTNIQRTGAQKRVSMSLELQQVSTVVDGDTHLPAGYGAQTKQPYRALEEAGQREATGQDHCL